MSQSMASSLGFIGEAEQKLFGTSFFGFKRDDVLSYVEMLNKSACDKTAELTTLIEKLENSLTEATQGNGVLAAKTQELETSLEEEASRANNIQEFLDKLRLEYDTVSDEAASYKSRLFTKEQESVVLKSDNMRLNTTIEALTKTVNTYEARQDVLANAEKEARLKIEELLQKAETDAQHIKLRAQNSAQYLNNEAKQEANSIREKASEEAVALLAAAEKEKNTAKLTLNSSAVAIAKSVALLKNEISAIDEKVSDALLDIGRLTNGISSALSETENNLETLGVQVNVFPQKSQQVQQKPVYNRPRTRKASVADSILDKLTKLLK